MRAKVGCRQYRRSRNGSSQAHAEPAKKPTIIQNAVAICAKVTQCVLRGFQLRTIAGSL